MRLARTDSTIAAIPIPAQRPAMRMGGRFGLRVAEDVVEQARKGSDSLYR
jgi:hypothetical protein